MNYNTSNRIKFKFKNSKFKKRKEEIKMTNLKEIEKIANEFNNDLEKVEKALKSVQSTKCRLKKQKYKSTYESEMNEVLKKEQVLKEVKALLNPKEKFVTDYDQSDIEILDYDQTVKAIKSIQSKKTHTRYLTPIEGDNDEYRKACQIESWLIEHKDKIRPIDETTIRKTDLITIIDTIKSNEDLSQERIVELLESLI